ncbi:tail fiber domain-containing protein [Enterobacter sp. ECC-175]|uniref:tail fiber domain-containing protein n=1 Tax=Enterobacter sp. ECC-175 TaxID=3116479 RepID=UPI0037547148
MVGTKNFLEVAGSVPGSQPLFYVVRRNQLNSTGQKVIQFPDAAGTIALTGTSDISYKKDIVDYDGLDSVEKILSLELKKFVYIDDEKGRTRRGIIAQQAQIVEPLYVKRTFEPDGTEQFDEKGNKISQALRERLVIDTNALQMDLLCALQVALRKIDSLEKLITKSAAADSSAG